MDLVHCGSALKYKHDYCFFSLLGKTKESYLFENLLSDLLGLKSFCVFYDVLASLSLIPQLLIF